MSGLAELSKAEWIIMKICWKHGTATARQVHEAVPAKRQWEYQTVKTMLDRMATKGYLTREKLGPLCLFKPAVSRHKAMGSAINGFMQTVLDDTLAPLLLHLAQDKRKLSGDEIRRIRELLEKHEEEK